MHAHVLDLRAALANRHNRHTHTHTHARTHARCAADGRATAVYPAGRRPVKTADATLRHCAIASLSCAAPLLPPTFVHCAHAHTCDLSRRQLRNEHAAKAAN